MLREMHKYYSYTQGHTEEFLSITEKERELLNGVL